MKRFMIVLLSVGLVLAGCSGPDIKKKDPTAGMGDEDTTSETKTATTSSSGGGGAGGDNVQVLTGGGAGSATPVTGGENMGGGGGGVSNAAKDQANRVKTKVTGDDHGADDDANTGVGD